MPDNANDGASTLGMTGTGGSGSGDGAGGARKGLAGAGASWKVRSSIGAAFFLASPKSWDRKPVAARHSSLADGVRLWRGAAEDFGVAAGVESGAGEGCWL